MLTRPLPDLDPLAAARGLAGRDGTLLLHTQRHPARPGDSWLLFDPVWTTSLHHGVWTDAGPAPRVRGAAVAAGERLQRLRAATAAGDDPWPLVAGAIGYEAGSTAFGCRHPVAAPGGLPDAWFGGYDSALRFRPGASPELLVRTRGFEGDRARRADALRARLEAAVTTGQPSGPMTAEIRFPDPGWHASAVDRIREHLEAGDSYQVNLTGWATARTAARPFEHFLRHSAANPVEFAAFLVIEGRSISCHSPELLLRVEGDHAETAPIKGTIAREAGSGARLRASEKDRAEHLMIVDLCRNDLGRRARTGTVRVEELMGQLEVRGIDHLVSRISARLRPEAAGGLLDSLFPGGSITGAPKRRSMEIITAVEGSGRGPYTGSIGYCAANGDLRFNIAIRTAVWHDGQVHFGCGGGIVIDSEAGAEYAEARLKAESFFAVFEGQRA